MLIELHLLRSIRNYLFNRALSFHSIVLSGFWWFWCVRPKIEFKKCSHSNQNHENRKPSSNFHTEVSALNEVNTRTRRKKERIQKWKTARQIKEMQFGIRLMMLSRVCVCGFDVNLLAFDVRCNVDRNPRNSCIEFRIMPSNAIGNGIR